MRISPVVPLSLLVGMMAGCDQRSAPPSSPPSQSASSPARSTPSSSSTPTARTPPTAAAPAAKTWTPPPPARIFRTRDELRSALQAAGINQSLDDVMAVARPSAMLTLTPTTDDDVPVGASKYGGHPDLPEALPPDVAAAIAPLRFVAQFNFAELAPVLHDDPIWPADGLLSIFLDPQNNPASPAIELKNSIRIIYTPTGAALTRCKTRSAVDAKTKEPFSVRTVNAEIAWSIPDGDSSSWEVVPQPRSRELGDLGPVLTNDFRYREQAKHLFGGYAIPEQYDPVDGIRDDYLAAQSGYDPTVRENTPLRASTRRGDTSLWRLVVQFDLAKDEELECCFGYTQFFIAASPKSIADRTFSEVFFIWDQD